MGIIFYGWIFKMDSGGGKKMSEKFNKFMTERRAVDRWFVLKVAIGGAFMGALLAVGFLITFGFMYP